MTTILNTTEAFTLYNNQNGVQMKRFKFVIGLVLSSLSLTSLAEVKANGQVVPNKCGLNQVTYVRTPESYIKNICFSKVVGEEPSVLTIDIQTYKGAETLVAKEIPTYFDFSNDSYLEQTHAVKKRFALIGEAVNGYFKRVYYTKIISIEVRLVYEHKQVVSLKIDNFNDMPYYSEKFEQIYTTQSFR